MASLKQRTPVRALPDRTAHSFSIMSRVDRSILGTFAHLGLSISHPPGTVLYEEGTKAEGIYLIQSGQIKLSCSAGQRSMILRIASTGEILGLSAILKGSSHEVTAKTLMPCDLTHISPSVFMDFLNSSAGAGAKALLALARDHREVFLSARRLALFPRASSRMAQVLIAFSALAGPRSATPRFAMLLSHAELASLIGTTRETVTRLLNDLERQKIIARDQSHIRILNRTKLARLAT